MAMEHKVHTGELVEKGIDSHSKERFLIAVTSTDDPDHDGDVIIPKGINLHKFTKKILWGHDLSGKTLPFGRSAWEKVDATGHKFLQKIMALPFDKLASNEAAFIGDLWTLYEAKILNEYSITFGDHTTRGFTSKELAENPSWKGANQIIPTCELIEVSAVKVGSNWNTDTIERAAKDLKINELTFKALGIEIPKLKTQVAMGEVADDPAETKQVIQLDSSVTSTLFTKAYDAEKVHKDSAGHEVKVMLVDGSKVRHELNQDFFGGDHDLHSTHIPTGTIWIDDGLDKKERDHVLAHELHERGNMSLGMGYENAHYLANKHEYEHRHGELPKWTDPTNQDSGFSKNPEPEVEVEEMTPKAFALLEPEVEEVVEVQEELPAVELSTKAKVEKALEHQLYLARGGV